MFRKLVVMLPAAVLALHAPAAMADQPTADCTFHTVLAGALSQTYEGTAEGYVIHAGDATATVRCYIHVDGVEVASTPTGTGATAGWVSYTASDTSTVGVCTEATTSHGVTTTCAAGPDPLPPQEVDDLLYEVLPECEVTGVSTDDSIVAVVPGPYVVTSDGMTTAEPGDCGGATVSASDARRHRPSGWWTCKKRPRWYSWWYYYKCSGTFRIGHQTCYVEWYERWARVDGSPWDDGGDDITYIHCR